MKALDKLLTFSGILCVAQTCLLLREQKFDEPAGGESGPLARRYQAGETHNAANASIRQANSDGQPSHESSSPPLAGSISIPYQGFGGNSIALTQTGKLDPKVIEALGYPAPRIEALSTALERMTVEMKDAESRAVSLEKTSDGEALRIEADPSLLGHLANTGVQSLVASAQFSPDEAAGLVSWLLSEHWFRLGADGIELSIVRTDTGNHYFEWRALSSDVPAWSPLGGSTILPETENDLMETFVFARFGHLFSKQSQVTKKN